jgi:hypothetical protein
MTDIYYIVGLIFLWEELQWIYYPIKKTENAKSFSDLAKEFKGKTWDEYSKEYKVRLKRNWYYVLILVWLGAGFMTAQWVIFLLYFVFNIIIIRPLSRLTKYSYAYTTIHWINSIIGFAVGLFIIINHYHLHINLYSFLTK